MIKKIALLMLMLLSPILFTFCDKPEPPLPPSNWSEIVIEGEIPPPRYDFSMTYVENSNKIILFAGGDETGTPFNDVWEFDTISNTWTEYCKGGVEGEDKPISRYGHWIAYGGNDIVVLYGGCDSHDWLGDTWEYDVIDHTWTEITGDSPPLLGHLRMAYGGNNNVILFGGTIGNLEYLEDTWEYSTETHTWTKIDITGSVPARRMSHYMEYIGNNQILMFGGLTKENWHNNDTWIYDTAAQTWTLINTGYDRPIARNCHAMARFCEDKVVLFGGEIEGMKKGWDTWIYDINEQRWTEYTTEGILPRKRDWQTMAYSGNDSAIMFGGNTGEWVDDEWEYWGLNDTWEYSEDKKKVE